MFGFLNLVPAAVWAIALLSVSTLYGFEVLSHGHTKVEAAEYKAEVAVQDSMRMSTALQAVEARAQVSNMRHAVASEVQNAVLAEKRKTDLAVSAGAATRSMLVSATASLTALRSEGVGDPQALRRAEERARAFGELLGTCDAVAEGLGREAEDLATQVRGLQRRYNSLLVVDPQPDGGKVDPHPPASRGTDMYTLRPDASVNSGVNGGLRFRRE